MSDPNILVISSVPDMRESVSSVMDELGLPATFTPTFEEAQTILSSHPFSMIFCSDELSGGIEDFIQQITFPVRKIPVVVILRAGEWERCLHFWNAGAFDCVAYPLSHTEVERITVDVLGLAHPRKMRPEKVRPQIAGAA